MTPKWVSTEPQLPVPANFGTTFGAGTPLVIDTSSSRAYYLSSTATVLPIFGSSAPLLDSTADIVSGTFPSSITRLYTAGFTSATDAGGASYDRTVSVLDPSGEGIWWFTAADGSKWQISWAPSHLAAQFGALGGASYDLRLILAEAYQSPNVVAINLGPTTHFMTGATTGDYSLLIPSGCGIFGTSPELSWIKLVPVTLGTQANPIQTIQFEDDVGGFARDFSLNCQRSGYGGGSNDRVSGLTIRSKNTDGSGTRVERVRVYNATGYGHYESADPGTTLRNIVRADCLAANCGVGFETTGNSEVWTPNCHTDASSTAWDGGTVIACEAMYHEYGAISLVNRENCTGYGEAGAGMFPVTVGADIGTIIYNNCEITITNTVPALRPLGQSGYVIRDLRVIGGKYTSYNADGCLAENVTMKAWGTTFHGGYDAETGAGNGAGINLTTGAEVDLYDCHSTGQSDTSGAGAAYGLLQQSTAVVRVYSGTYEAIGPAGLMTALGGTVTEVSPAYLIPAPASTGTELPRYRQWKRGTSTGWALYVDGTNRFNFINITLDTSVADRALVDFLDLTIQTSDSDLSLMPSDIGIRISWQSDAQIQIQIPPGVTTTNLTLRYSVIEWL